MIDVRKSKFFFEIKVESKKGLLPIAKMKFVYTIIIKKISFGKNLISMEFLFTNQLAFIESILLILCILTIIGIYFFDGYKILMRIIWVLTPRKAYIQEAREDEKEIKEEASLLHPETAEIIEEYLSEKNEWENITTLETLRTDVSNTEKETIEEQNKEVLDAIDPESPYKELLTEHTAQMLPEKKEEILLEMHPVEELFEPVEEKSLLKSADEEKLLPSSKETLLLDEVPEEKLIEAPSDEKILEAPEVEHLITQTKNPELISEKSIWELKNDLDVSEKNILPEEENRTELAQEEEKFDIEKVQQRLQEEVNAQKKYIPPTPVFEEKTKLPQISPEKREKLTEIVNTVKTLLARSHIIEARGMIVNGLALQKEHRELNILLAWIYERERDYVKSEYIYKDLARIYIDDVEILIHLADALAMQRKYDVSYEIYKKVLSLGGETEEILYTLSHLSAELSLPEETYEYAKSYIRQYPKNPEVLWLFAQSQIALERRKEAIETLIKLKNLTPYNQEILDLIQKLVTEEELAGNFWG